jgi:endoglucanase
MNSLLLCIMYMNLHHIECLLSTDGPYLINTTTAKRVRLKCVNWYGAHQELFSVGGLEVQTISNISQQIILMGANCVRIPFSIEMTRENPRVRSENTIAVNSNDCPRLDNIMMITALELLDCVVNRLTDDGLMVIMNNHVSKAGWIGANTTVNDQGLWNLPGYPTTDWIASLRNISDRYSRNSLVVGMDIRNEIHDQVSG